MYLEKTKKVKNYIISTILVIALMMLFGCTPQQSEANSGNPEPIETIVEVSPANSLKLLEEGNARFSEMKVDDKDISVARRENLSKDGQHPFAVIVSCSDSRVPPEVIFDQALGDLFVVRVAGNVIDSVALGSIEYAVEHLETPLVVVMGHEKCGAVKATVDGGEAPGSIGSIVEKIQPSVEKVKASGTTENDLYEEATDENILQSLEEIEKSPIVEHFIENGTLKVIGAKYHLESGKVEFFSDPH
ncbi:carbonic anhydrase [Clostridium formicaceticum]|uniref:Carbonic anhydrase n=1 Tax=Clostridium formicaceticum TaxID=1497 RepID=A0AAC9WH58_9CLOT|nr:carbonic anhydrase [Clostridium formicaceticum]AOY77954.1 carbonic anhydrase [Clostridium formicaceticum]ARE88576.1 Carbonic anhydrase [Clostridium formicaceticum]